VEICDACDAEKDDGDAADEDVMLADGGVERAEWAALGGEAEQLERNDLSN
jgi:hypothetical protein